MAKRNAREEKKYDWVTVERNGSIRELNGYGTEMCLKPVPVDPDTGEQSIFKAGKNKGKKKAYPAKEWQTGKIQIIWMWPGGRIATLLKLLKEARLVGAALLDVTALKSVVNGKAPTGIYADSEGWARDLIRQEEEKYERQKAERKEELRKRRGQRASRKKTPTRARASSGNTRRRKQVDGDESKGRPRSSSRRRTSAGSGKTSKGKNTKNTAR